MSCQPRVVDVRERIEGLVHRAGRQIFARRGRTRLRAVLIAAHELDAVARQDRLDGRITLAPGT